jgi:hypothetical protein
VVKANHAATGTTIPLVWRDKLLVPESPPSGIMGSVYRRSAKRVFMDLLDKITAEGRHVSDSIPASNYAPKLFARRPGNERYKVGEFRSAMETLFDIGEIRVGNYGREGSNHHRIVRCQHPEEAILDGAAAPSAKAPK